MLRLIEFEPIHFDVLCSWFESERDLVRWGGSDLRYPLDHAQLRRVVADRPGRLSWMALDSDDDLVGHIQLVLEPDTRSARVARVAIAPLRRGGGLGRPLVGLALEVAWGIDWVDQVELRVYTWNAPALATYRGLGFVTERIDPSRASFDGERWEHATMKLARPR